MHFSPFQFRGTPWAAATAMLLAGIAHPQEVPADHAARMAASTALFKNEVGPLLREKCLDCHGGAKTKSGFSLATRSSALGGGDQGVAIVPGNPGQSLLLAYLKHQEEPHMPPKEPRLPDPAIAGVEKWIQLGAAYDQPLIEGATEAGQGAAPMRVRPEDRNYWAYRPLANTRPPEVADPAWSENPVDRFIAAAHARHGLTPSPALDRARLARRMWFGVIGLPPSPGDIRGFVASEDPLAEEKLIDSLLASPQFGERWARHWLDVARYAESHGFEHDTDRPFAYHFRDFVIRAFNADMPYDQFVRWQIAGDELAPNDPMALMATGFLGAGVFPTQITISEAERVRYDALDDMVATMGSAMLATTIGCARCHDHKYDPIPTSDYYSLLSAFTTTVRTDVDLDLSALGNDGVEKVMICSEGPDVKPMRLHTSSGSIPDFYEQSYELLRGDVNQKGPVAALGFLSVMMDPQAEASRWQRQGEATARTSLRRAAVANWITDTEAGAGALLARVIVNRLWQHHFGRGLVATPSDFGFQGEAPSHPELLDWLAGELIRGGWRLKRVHKLILQSRAYRMGDAPDAANYGIDPENHFLWRRPARRLEAEAIRDNALAASGTLDTRMFGQGTLDSHMKRRSIYFQVKRSQLPPVMQLFDWPDTLTSLGERATTTTPTQALVFINSPELREMARQFATTLIGSSDAVTDAYWQVFGRAPGDEERASSAAFLENQALMHGGDRHAALADFCQALMGMNEFIYID